MGPFSLKQNLDPRDVVSINGERASGAAKVPHEKML